jgi:hypothetical protein
MSNPLRSISLCEERIALLAKQRDGAATNEEAARLETLTRRLRHLHPRVTKGDLERLDAMGRDLEKASADLDDVRSKLLLR